MQHIWKTWVVPRWPYSIFLILAFVILGSIFFREFDHDEFEALHSAWKIHAGELIYRDFLQQHHFLLYFLLSPLFSVFNEGTAVIFAARFVSLGFFMGSLMTVYRLAHMISGKCAALLAVLLLVTTVTFFEKAIEIRPDVPLVFFELLSVFWLLRYFRNRKIRDLVLSAVAVFVAFLFLQKAVLLILLFAVLFCYQVIRRQMSWREVFIFSGVLGGLLLSSLLFVSLVFGLREYLFLNWEINMHLLNTFPITQYLEQSFQENPVLWGVFAIGVGKGLWKRVFNPFVYFALGLLLFIFTTKSPFPQYYLPSLPFVALVAAQVLKSLFSSERWKYGAYALVVVSLCGTGYAMAREWEDNTSQLKRVQYVLDHTTPNDLVYDGDAEFNIFRHDLDYFWFSVKPETGVLSSYRILRPYEYEPYRLIREKKPKIISNSFLYMKHPDIAEWYTKAKDVKDIYVRNPEP